MGESEEWDIVGSEDPEYAEIQARCFSPDAADVALDYVELDDLLASFEETLDGIRESGRGLCVTEGGEPKVVCLPAYETRAEYEAVLDAAGRASDPR